MVGTAAALPAARYEVYCDESRQDRLTSKASGDRFFLIGSIWIAAADRDEVKAALGRLKAAHKKYGEIKWRKVSPAGLAFYRDLVDLFVDYGERLRFRCIVVDSTDIDLERFHEGDHELGFYKFYYQLLAHWTGTRARYAIFCDAKTNRVGGRLATLKRCLNNVHVYPSIESIQAIPSHESVLIQLADFLLGAVGARFNAAVEPGSAKLQIVKYLEERLGVDQLRRTTKSEGKFNVFEIRLQGDAQ